MYPIPPTETLVQTKTCRHCQVLFPITDKDLEFYEKVSPSFPLNRHSELVSESSAFPNNKEYPGSSPGWRNIKIEWDKVRYLIPTPTLCPDCRQQRRLSFRNERKLYKRKCDATNKDIISIYSPDKPFKVYHQDYWWSDKWDPMDYGREFYFGRGFFEQFGELMREVPLLWVVVVNDVENSPFTNFTAKSKNIYMCADVMESEDVYFSSTIKKLITCCDCTDLESSEDCYYCSFSRNLFHCEYINYSKWCSNSKYLYDCQWVSNSLFCVWLRNKSYHILNKPVSREEFEQRFQQIDTEAHYAEYMKLLSMFPKKHLLNVETENCIWDNLINSSDCFSCFDSVNLQHSKYVSVWHTMDFCMDTTIHNPDCLYSYEAINGGKLTGSAFIVLWWGGMNTYYCSECIDSNNLFWCIGLRNKQYCILNKQYTREEYETLVPRIIEHMQKTGEWGEFFPSSLSPFGYNETVAQEYYPLDRRDAINRVSTNGARIFNWSDYEAPFPKVEKIIPADKLPDDISKIPDDILNWAIECEVTKKPFRIIKQELEFYRKHNLPIPRRHPDQRHLDRMALRNPRKLFERKCDKCGVEMVTTYSPERPERVYCWACYDTEVLW